MPVILNSRASCVHLPTKQLDPGNCEPSELCDTRSPLYVRAVTMIASRWPTSPHVVSSSGPE